MNVWGIFEKNSGHKTLIYENSQKFINNNAREH